MAHTYQWSNYYDSSVHTSGYTPSWWTVGSVKYASSPDPFGGGGTLVRHGVSIDIAVYNYTIGAFANPAEGHVHDVAFATDVYETGVIGLPVITGHFPAPGALSGTCEMTSQNLGGKVDGVFVWRAQTPAMVWSEAQRGPAYYGGGVGELRLAIAVSNCGLISDEMGGYTIAERVWMRGLWKSP
jgi:hypothetical protein